MTTSEEGKSNASGYLMLLIGVIAILTGWTVVLEGYASTMTMFAAMMIVQVIGIVLAFLGLRIVFDPARRKAPAPSPYSEFSVVCERCEKEVPSGAENCPNCGNPIEWD
ncbi:MAG: zinc ribbon domain-containing protein [Methanomassiliicoccales archaeon]|jgi:uncharacterized membrane protein HdeD (DUF308 family)|nr:zinc ribbon domain-containing protein [Methanomassiliicoccales archaeon]MDD1756188.1 zinc ribbon domain-containing protein [Methanomassiliicoccales archaeon]